MPTPKLRFLSLFVDDLDRAREAYSKVFGLQPLADDDIAPAPANHPYSPRPPVVFDLGGVRLALYQVDGRITHTGDVGIGVVTDEAADAVAARVGPTGGQLLRAPDGPPAGAAPLLVFTLPERHFFELLAGRGDD